MAKDRPFPGLATPESIGQAGGEFTDRDPQVSPTRITVPLVQEGRAQEEMKTTRLGEPPIDVDVRSVYDVRPINAFDVNLQTSTGNISQDGDGNINGTATVAVPYGYVFVLRQIDHVLSPYPTITDRSQALMRVQRNGADVPYNVDVPVGNLSQGLFRTFIIFDEGELVGVAITIDLTLASPVITTNMFVNLYGNFLRKTGRPAMLEIGNPVRVPVPLSMQGQKP